MQLDRKSPAFALLLFPKELNDTIDFLHESEEAKADEQLKWAVLIKTNSSNGGSSLPLLGENLGTPH
jgi:hypothetical protein